MPTLRRRGVRFGVGTGRRGLTDTRSVPSTGSLKDWARKADGWFFGIPGLQSAAVSSTGGTALTGDQSAPSALSSVVRVFN